MKEKIPVFIISGKSPLGISGGYASYSYILSRILTSLGYQVYILVIEKESSVKKTTIGEIRFISTKLITLFPLIHHLALAGLPYYSFLFVKEIKKITQEKKIDKFILWGMGPWGFPGVLLKLFPLKKAKMFMATSYFTSTRHEMKGSLEAIRIKDYGVIPKIKYLFVYEVVARIFHVFEKLTLDACQLVVIHYESSRKIIKKYFQVTDKKIHYFPWYIEIIKRKVRKNAKIKYPHPLIVSISRQDPRKGINILLKAIKILSQETTNFHCLIVGTGSFFELNKKLAKRLKLEKFVHFTGFAPDIKPILIEADVVVIVPLAQGSSALTVIEAMSYGKAIIASRCDGIPEDLKNNTSGLIVNRGDEKSLARALKRLIKNPKLQKKLEENVSSTYKKRFGFNIMKAGVKKALEQSLKDTKWKL